MQKTLTFDGINLLDYSCWFDGSDSFRIPEKQYEFFEVVGRNGDLAISHDRYSNIDISFNCFINKEFRKNFIALINDLSAVNGYGRLETSDEPDVFRMGMFVSDVQPSLWQADQGSFHLTFNCKPQKWLKSGESAVTINSSTTLINPCRMPSKPLIEVVGTGSITINSSTLTLATNTGTTMIDCDLEDAYEGTINRNPDLTVTGGFPVLVSENEVSYSGFTSVKIYPRWWRL